MSVSIKAFTSTKDVDEHQVRRRSVCVSAQVRVAQRINIGACVWNNENTAQATTHRG